MKREEIEDLVLRVIDEHPDQAIPDEDIEDAIAYYAEVSGGDICQATTRLFYAGKITRDHTQDPWRRM